MLSFEEIRPRKAIVCVRVYNVGGVAHLSTYVSAFTNQREFEIKVQQQLLLLLQVE